ncbi:glycosyltransferase [Brevundimonas vesicularis]|uniref:glycosyltransferase n=1 Tax=Brevundimonas vesicularis TaxID=41276 RepID=UPI0038D39F86
MQTRSSNSPKGAINTADAARDARNWGEAERHYAKALELNPNLDGIWVQYGHALKEQGKFEEAGQAYDRALALAPDVADTHLQMGHLLKLRGKLEEAANAYIKAVELDPALSPAVQEARTLIARGVTTDNERLFDALEGGQSTSTALPNLSLAQLADQLERRLANLGSDTGEGEDRQALLGALSAGLAAARQLSETEQDIAKSRLEASAHVVFDVSDLMGYFDNARLPTGIQRVQIEVITALLLDPVDGVAVEVCSFSRQRDAWVAVPLPLFLKLCELALLSGDRTELRWTETVKAMKDALDIGRTIKFRQGAYLINLGTSWWLQNYFLQVRAAKETSGIHYIPFVHDMIPVMTPEHCVQRLTKDFISWALGVYAHADHFLTNSKASRDDLIAVGKTLGYEVKEEQVQVIRLNADFRKPLSEVPMAETMKRYGLRESSYVLFVSTIESRKNHMAAFKAWLELIRKYGADRTLKLVCVGNRGWLNDEVFAMLDNSAELRSRIMMVSGVSDPDLANLYKGCAFTLYPSSYEGWGLPVTESLCYGKPALLSDSSSLPEAGGEFADYFKLGDQDGLVAKLEQLMFDAPYRKQRQDNIVANFQPRPWRELGVEIAETIKRWFPEGEANEAMSVRAVPDMGRYYWLRDVADAAIYPNMRTPEIFRTGEGWWFPDDWGSWTKPRGGALQFHLEPNRGDQRLYVGLLGLQRQAAEVEIRIGGMVERKLRLNQGETRWLALDISEDAYESGALQVSFRSDRSQNFADYTDGVDTRVTGVGIIGFMMCGADDLISRANFTEALTMRELPALARKRS